MRNRTVFDGATGVISMVPYTPEEEAQADLDKAADDAYQASHPTSHLNGGSLIRFTATNPITVLENIGMAGVTRRAKGWFRALHQTPMPSAQYSVFPDVLDAADKRVRVVARTVDYVDVKVVDSTGAAADATEVSIKIERVIS